MEYYIQHECPKCGQDVYDRAANFAEHKGIPVFSLDQFSQYNMTCDSHVYKKDDDLDADKFILEEGYNNLSEEEQKDWHLTSCGYNFGTGDIDVIGEDEI